MTGAYGEDWGPGQAEDNRPEYSPAGLVLAVKRVLAQSGVEVDPGPNEMHVASLAAADLLRALGVRPASVPTMARRSKS